MRGGELVAMQTSQIKLVKEGNYEVIVPNTKNKKPHKFQITGNYVDMISRYWKLRPANITTHNRFFINYQNGKCTSQPIGKNQIAKMPSQVATFLNLEDAAKYTGHSYRRSGAKLLADSGASMMDIKRMGNWDSTGSALGNRIKYIHSFM